MKNLKEILESQNFLVNKKLNNRQDKYEYHPTTKDELKDIIIDLLKQGITNLNCIDVSKIDDMYDVFDKVNHKVPVKDIDISEWDVSNVKDMAYMFDFCTEFNADLSKWDVSNVEDTRYMFDHCYEFNSDLSKWNVSNVKDTRCMFNFCKKFNSDLSNWNVSKITGQDDRMRYMFFSCTTLEKNNKIPSWYSN